MRVPLLLMTLLLATPTLASDRIYTWVDGDGVRHYSQNPPPAGVRFEERGIAPAPAPPPPAEPAAAGAGPRLAPAEATRRCTAARQRLALLTDTTQTVGYDRNGDGVAEPMSDADKQKEIDTARAEEALACPQVPIT
jgi:ABC-type glycerol-3-phosphate transport system substrate-binding protein